MSATPKIPVNFPVPLLFPDKQDTKNRHFGNFRRTVHKQTLAYNPIKAKETSHTLARLFHHTHIVGEGVLSQTHLVFLKRA